ncbi:MAG: SdpI family protein [Candidatus Shapirobacteria bacterium]
MKFNKIKIIFPVFLILISFVLATYFYQIFPDTLATHWGINGEVNGYSSKAFGLFFMPIMSVFLLALFIFLPHIDPYKKNFSEFKKYFENFVNLILGFLFYIYILTLVWNSGHQINITQLIAPAIGVIFYYAGVLMQHAKRNWFVGIRTPWTMSSVVVWEKTHALGAKLFKIAGLLSLFGIILPQYSLFFIIIPILAITIFIFVYSYWEYRKLA